MTPQEVKKAGWEPGDYYRWKCTRNHNGYVQIIKGYKERFVCYDCRRAGVRAKRAENNSWD